MKQKTHEQYIYETKVLTGVAALTAGGGGEVDGPVSGAGVAAAAAYEAPEPLRSVVGDAQRTTDGGDGDQEGGEGADDDGNRRLPTQFRLALTRLKIIAYYRKSTNKPPPPLERVSHYSTNVKQNCVVNACH